MLLPFQHVQYVQPYVYIIQYLEEVSFELQDQQMENQALLLPH